MIKIDFSKTHDVYGTFSDALHLEENHYYTDAEIEEMKQQRFDNWVEHITEMSNRPIHPNALSAAEIVAMSQINNQSNG
jgi:hypothetical protein